MDQECMVFIEHGNVGLQTVHKEKANLVVRGLLRHEPVPEKDSLGVGVHNKCRPVSGIKEDAVSRLRSDAFDG